MKRLQQGFTLIELMIVVAIIGILAAIALPAYQDYVIRSKVSEAAAAVGACKTSFSEYAATKGSYPTTVADAGCSTAGSQYVASIAVNKNIVVTTANTKAQSAECVLTLSPGGTEPAITGWTGTHSGCDAKYVPSSFR